MKMLCITDLHGDHRMLERILLDAGPADLVLLGGDITHFGTPNVAEAVVRRLQQTGVKVLAVAGNCDSQTIDQRLIELGVSLFGRGIQHGQVGFHGVSAMPPWRGTMYELTEEQIANALCDGDAPLVEAPYRVLLSHSPPHGTSLDRTRHGDHVGSTAVREFIDRRQPSLVVCGHIHEGRGVDRLGDTHVVNCGPANRGCYAQVELNAGFEIHLRCLI